LSDAAVVLALSGSLRGDSSNGALLRAALALAPSTLAITYDTQSIAALPHFNPDLDTAEPPAAVRAFRERLGAAEGVIICSPEYAHGVPGALKNALDWIVSSGESQLTSSNDTAILVNDSGSNFTPRRIGSLFGSTPHLQSASMTRPVMSGHVGSSMAL